MAQPVESFKVLHLRLDLIVNRTPQRASKILQILQELGIEDFAEGGHVMSTSFLGDADEPYYVDLQVDQLQLSKKSKRLDYFLQLNLIRPPSSRPPKALRERKQKISWCFAKLESLRIAPNPCIVEVEASTTRPSSRPVAAVPLSIGGRPLLLIGAEYRGEETKTGQVRDFRWSDDRDGVTNVWLSYLWHMGKDVSLSKLWELHAKIAEKHTEEALRQ